MLEGIWYSLLVVIQLASVNPNYQNKDMKVEVYHSSERILSISLKGRLTEGSFYDQISKKSIGNFELGRTSPRNYSIIPKLAFEEKTDEKTDAKATKDVKSSPSPSMSPLPTPFFLDLSKITALAKNLAQFPEQKFPALIIEKKDSKTKTDTSNSETSKKDEKKEESFVNIVSFEDTIILSDPENDLVLVVHFE